MASLRFVLMLVPVAVLLCPNVSAYGVRQDVDNGDYLVGHLTWNQGQGGIGWGGGDSVDPGGSGTSEDTFLGSPLPTTLRLNASRFIQVDLYKVSSQSSTNHNSCGYKAELLAGDVFVGGVDGPQGFDNFGDGSANLPAHPPGYIVCRIRIATEVSELPEGTVLRLRLTALAGATWGMAEGHQSVVRMPFFSVGEIPYRFPVYAHGGPGVAAAGVAERLLTGAGLAAMVIGLRMSRDGRPGTFRSSAWVLALLLLGLGGCVAPGPTPQPIGAGDQPIDRGALTPVYQEGNLSSAGLGSLIGQVHASDNGEPIQGAFVSLLRTSNGTRTDPFGRFTFRDLPAGDYHVRVDKDGYQPFEGGVRVAADLIARVDIALDPMGAVQPGSRAHRHDYWGTETDIVLMDKASLGTTCPDVTASDQSCQANTVFIVPPKTKEFTSIRPGTYLVTVTLGWEGGSLATTPMGLLFQGNNDPSLVNWSELLPRPVGEPFHIVTTWEMSDPGHQMFSTWVFQVTNVPKGPALRTQPAEWVTRHGEQPTIDVTVAIRKGVVPLEPAHPDPWKGASRIVVIDQERQWPIESSLGKGWDDAWIPSKTIPPDTTWIEVYANRSSPPIVPYEVGFRYRTAEHGVPSAACWANLARAGDACNGPEYKHVGPGEVTGTSNRWTIAVLAAETDHFYTQRSFWIYGLNGGSKPQDLVAQFVNSQVDYAQHPGSTSLSYDLTVIAHRDLEPTA